MAAPKKGTRKRMLDAAEKLFAENGFEGTSTRAIAAESGDTIGTLNYHFGSKESLLSEVLNRRFELIMEARRAAFEKAKAKSANHVSLEAVVESIVLPYLEFAFLGNEGWRSYILLQARLLYHKASYEAFLAKVSEPFGREGIQWLKLALPGASAKNVGYAYQFMLGIMVETCSESDINRIAHITDGKCEANNFREIKKRLIPFICAGIRAIAPFKYK